MYKRKQYLIDKKFQLKTTFSIIGIVIIVTAFIIGVIATNIVYNNEKIDNIHTIENNIFDFLTSSDIRVEREAYHSTIKEIIHNHNNNMITLRGIIRVSKILLVALIIVVITESIVLYILLIRRTHRISGPIYVMTNYMRQLLNGQYPLTRPLRSSDEFQEFYGLFLQLIEQMKAKETPKGSGTSKAPKKRSKK